MNIRVSLEAPPAPGAFALVTLYLPDGGAPCELRVDARPLAELGAPPSDEALELVLLGAVAYALDRRVERAKAADAWTRAGTANQARVSVRALAWITAGHELHHREILRDRYGLGTG